MEEINRIALEYYRNTTKFRFWGWNGGALVILSLLLLSCSLYLAVVRDTAIFGVPVGFIFVVPAVLLFSLATSIFNKNMHSHLVYVMSEQKKLPCQQKAAYLNKLVYGIATNNFDAAKTIIELQRLTKETNQLHPDNFWYFVRRFIFNKDSIVRVNAWLIYGVSLVALLMISSNDIDINFTNAITLWWNEVISVQLFLLLFIFTVILLFILQVFMTVYSTILLPMLRMSGVSETIVNHLVSELVKYSFVAEDKC